jgi:replicative DNA helicase
VPGYHDNRVQEVGAIARALKSLARDLNVPVLTASQLNRQIETRNDREPNLSDLRESGDIEASADVVIFLWSADPKGEDPDKPRKVNVKIGKQRGGARNVTRTVLFNAPFVRFNDLAQGEL